VKNAYCTASTLQSAMGKKTLTGIEPMEPEKERYGKEMENNWVLTLILNVRRHCKVVISDDKLFQVLAAATRNTRSPKVWPSLEK